MVRQCMAEEMIIIVAVVVWDAVPTDEADAFYEYIGPTLAQHGIATGRRCGMNATYV